MKYYAGIGSRETPKEYLDLFEKVGEYLSAKGYTLRSGGANGADSAFERGCDSNRKEIYVPWNGFEGITYGIVVSDKRAFEIAKKFHPYWDRMKQGAQKLHARNSHQVLGKDLETPSQFVICWTKDGKLKGGTAEAIRIAEAYDIPVFNCGGLGDIGNCKKELREFLKKMLK